MLIWLLILTIGLPVGWLVAEFKGGRFLRIGLGLLTIVILNIMIFTCAQVVRRYEKDYIRLSFQNMHHLLQSGHTGEVIKAIELYQATVTNDTPFSFQGASALYYAIRQKTTPGESSGSPNPHSHPTQGADGR